MRTNKRWATIYLLINSPEFIKQSEVISLLQPLLTNFQTNQAPVISNFLVTGKPDEDLDSGMTVTSGPFTGLVVYSGNKLSAIKWNINSKNNSKIPEATIGLLRDNFRKLIKPNFTAKKFDVLQMSIAHYGEKLAGDKGIPKTPSLPRVVLPPTPAPTPAPTPKPFVADMTFTLEEVYPEKKSSKPLWILALIAAVYAVRRGM